MVEALAAKTVQLTNLETGETTEIGVVSISLEPMIEPLERLGESMRTFALHTATVTTTLHDVSPAFWRIATGYEWPPHSRMHADYRRKTRRRNRRRNR